MYDVFVADLRCPNCNATASVKDGIGMQTHIRGSVADGSELGIGCELEANHLAVERIVGSGYALIREPAPDGVIRLLDIWTCPMCHAEQWAMVTISEQRIRQIDAVTLNRSALETANFISAIDASILAERLAVSDRETSVDILRQHLPQ
jgi:hypothetical protein